VPSTVSTSRSHGVPGFQVVGLSRWRRFGRSDFTVSFPGSFGASVLRPPSPSSRRLSLGDAFQFLLPDLSVRILSWGFQRCPSVDLSFMRPLRCCRFLRSRLLLLRQHVGLPLPPGRSRSTFTVSHRPDGFLRTKPRGFVAPRCRPWGPSSFGLLPWFPCGLPGFYRSHRREHPSKLFPRQKPSPILIPLGRSCPLVVTRRLRRSEDLCIVRLNPGSCDSGSSPGCLRRHRPTSGP
jgi:hypothetical protein